MLTIEDVISEKISAISLGIIFAEDVLHIFEKEYPNDSRPRRAISLVNRWLTEEVTDVIYNSAYTYAFKDVSDVAIDIFNIDSAAHSAAYSAYSAITYDAAYSAKAAYDAICIDNVEKVSMAFYIHEVIMKNLSSILRLHIRKGISFGNPERIFSKLSDLDKEEFIFHINTLR